jgi:hypothetical protein
MCRGKFDQDGNVADDHQALAILPLLPWLIFARLSLLGFDSSYKLSSVLIVGTIWLSLGCAIRAWWLDWRGNQRGAVMSTSVPL